MLVKINADISGYRKDMEAACEQMKSFGKETELYGLKNNLASNSSKLFHKQLENQKAMQTQVQQEINSSVKMMDRLIDKYGETAPAVLKMKNKILDLEIQQEKLNKTIKEAPLERFKQQLESVSQKMTSIGRSMSYAITLPLLAAGTAATKMAMDAIESENLFEVSMGDMAKEARKWSEELSGALGLNEYAVRNNVATFNVMFDSMGLGKKAALDMSEGLTKLAYDMASFYNMKPEAAFEKLQAGISGEVEPLKRLGIVVSETTVKAYAYTHGIAKQGQELTEQQKILARYGVIMAATGKAQGDLARTLDSPTNQLRLMGEQAKQLAIDMGQALIPVLGKLIDFVKPIINWFRGLSDGAKILIISVLGVAAAIGPLIAVAGKAIGIFNAIRTAVLAFSTATGIATGTVILIIAGITALAAAAFLLYKNWQPAAKFFQSMWDVIKSAFASAGAAITVAIRSIQLEFAKFISFTIGSLATFYSAFFSIMSKIPGIGGVFETAKKGIDSFRGGLDTLVKSSEEALNLAKGNLKSAADKTAEGWKNMTDAGAEFGKGVANTVKTSIGNVKKFFNEGAKDIKAAAPEYKAAGTIIGDALKDPVVKAARDTAEETKKQLDRMKDDINRLNDAVVSSLRRRYEQERRLSEKNISDSLRKLEEWKEAQTKAINNAYSTKTKLLDADTKSQVDALQSQIDALDEQMDAAERAAKDKEELDRITGLRSKLSAAVTAEEKQSIQDELNAAILERENRLQKEMVEAQKAALRQQIENLQSAADQKREQLQQENDAEIEKLNESYKNRKASLDAQMEAIKEFYDEKLSSSELAAEAEKLIMEQNQKDIIKLLEGFGDLYEDSGMSLGERLFKGIKLWAQLIPGLVSDAAAGIKSATGGATGYNPTGKVGADALLAKMQQNSKSWFAADNEGKEELHQENESLAVRLKSEFGLTPTFDSKTGKWNVLKYSAGTTYHPGGPAIVGEMGPELLIPPVGSKVIPNNRLPGNVVININHPVIRDRMDIHSIGAELVNYLKLKGLKLNNPY